MKDEITVNKANGSITFTNNGIAFSQFGVADEILDLITNLQEKYEEADNDRHKLFEQKEKAIEYIRSEFTITDDDVYLALYSSDGTLDKLETILQGDDKDE